MHEAESRNRLFRFAYLVMAALCLALLVQGIVYSRSHVLFGVISLVTTGGVLIGRPVRAKLLFVLVPLGPIINMVVLYRDPYLYNAEVVLLAYFFLWFLLQPPPDEGIALPVKVYLVFCAFLLLSTAAHLDGREFASEIRMARGHFIGLCLVLFMNGVRKDFFECAGVFVKMMTIGLFGVALLAVLVTGYASMANETVAILPHSVFGGSESLAIYLSLLLPVGLAYRKSARQKAAVHMASVACIGGFVLLLSTRSRSALLALLTVGAVYVVVNWKHRPDAFRRPLAIVGFLIVAISAVVTIVHKSFAFNSEAGYKSVEQAMSHAFSSRMDVWSSGATYILNNPFCGYGYAKNVYNLYLQIGSSFGVPALVTFLVLLFISFKGTGEETAPQRSGQNIVNGLHWGMMALLLTSLGESTWGNSFAYMNWCVLFLIAFRQRALENPKDTRKDGLPKK